MRRRIAIIIVFLLLGAIANVAVAWGHAYYLDAATMTGVENLHLGTDGRRWIYNRFERVGSVFLCVWADPYECESESAEAWSDRDRRDLPRWLVPRLHPTFDGGIVGAQYFEARGWPVPALWQEFIFIRCADDPTQWRFPVRGGIAFGDDDSVPMALPMVPWWPGFAINSLFYALLLWLLFVAPFTVRRALRRRRGQCEQCAYPIGVSPVCTECGAAVAPRTAAVFNQRRCCGSSAGLR